MVRTPLAEGAGRVVLAPRTSYHLLVTDEITMRRATADDADEMARLRRDMQAELLTTGDRTLALDAASPRQNRDYFREKLPTGEFVAFLAETGGVIVGTGGIVVYRAPPTQGNPTGIEGYVMNMYTVPSYRGRGIATRLLDHLVEHVRDLGGRRAWLRASDSGRPVYHRYGFRGDDPHYMLYPFPQRGP
jgi:GNAT superfamily N-acetyltransferase